MTGKISSKFKKEGTWFLTKEQYQRFLEGKEYWGRPDGQFIIPTSEADKLSDEFLRLIEKRLGFPKNYFKNGEGLMRIDIKNIEKYNPRAPDGKENGVNNLFRKGGKTIGGIPEAIIDPIHYTEAIRKGLFSIIVPSFEEWIKIDTYPVWVIKEIEKCKLNESAEDTFFLKGKHFLYRIIYKKNKIEVFKKLRDRWVQYLKPKINEESTLISHHGQKYYKITKDKMAEWVLNSFNKELKEKGSKIMGNSIRYYKGGHNRYIIITNLDCENNKYYWKKRANRK